VNWRYQPEARLDFFDQVDFYDEARDGFGEIFAGRVAEFIERILLNPQLNAKVKRAPRGRDVREGKLEQFVTVVTYEVRVDEIVILAITDGRRNRRPWRGRLAEL
jgi:hypothetical protein